ncbi:hypothetical protein GCM10028799_71910 [Kribbella italica]
MPGGGSRRELAGSKVRYGGTEKDRNAATANISGTIQGRRHQACAGRGGDVGGAFRVEVMKLCIAYVKRTTYIDLG